MTTDEFNIWLADFTYRFPTTVNWIRADNKPDRPEVWTGIMRSWRETLGDVQFDDALAATKGMQAGTLEDWGKNSDRIPAMVRRHAHYRQLQRTPNSEADDPRLPPRSPNGLRFGEMYRYVLKAVEDGTPKEVWLIEGMKRLGNVTQDREPKYRCPTCRDTGFVIVWSRSATKAYRLGELDSFKSRRSCAVGCRCSKARKWLELYDPVKHCQNSDDGRSERDISSLEKHIAESAMSGDFADWNRAAGHIA